MISRIFVPLASLNPPKHLLSPAHFSSLSLCIRRFLRCNRMLVLDGEIERVAHSRSSWVTLAQPFSQDSCVWCLYGIPGLSRTTESESERRSKNKRKHRSGEGAEGCKKRMSTTRQDSDTDPADSASPPRSKRRAAGRNPKTAVPVRSRSETNGNPKLVMTTVAKTRGSI